MPTIVKPPRVYGKFHVVSGDLPMCANPVACNELKNIEDVEKHRRMLCMHQTSCCTFAAAEQWPGFSCLQCFAFQAMTPDQQKADIEGLALLLASIS